jgi:hypothetical protein
LESCVKTLLKQPFAQTNVLGCKDIILLGKKLKLKITRAKWTAGVVEAPEFKPQSHENTTYNNKSKPNKQTTKHNQMQNQKSQNPNRGRIGFMP